jgi:hypothetical protein
MDTSGPNLLVMLVIGLLAAATLLAWLLSERRRKHTRALALYLRKHEPEFWSTLPWHARNLNIVGAIERYRRAHESVDPAFAELYAAKRRSARIELSLLLLAGSLVALLVVGLKNWGWHF